MLSNMTDRFKTHNVVSNDLTFNPDQIDPNLINAWGIVEVDNSIWINSNQGHFLIHYDLRGNVIDPPSSSINIPINATISSGGSPTGLVVNNTNGFPTQTGLSSPPSSLILCTLEGLICTYNPSVNPTQVFIVASTAGAIYTGLTIIDNYLYVANFSNNSIDVFALDFTKLNFGLLNNSPFVDKKISDPIPTDYAPFNVANIDNYLFVAYAKQFPASIYPPVIGSGNGFISIFRPDGTFIRRFASRDPLDTPWAMMVAPYGFGVYEGQLLVGNNGDGTINVFNIKKYSSHLGKFIDSLRDINCDEIILDGLYGLTPIYHHNVIYAASGPGSSTLPIGLDGLITRIRPLGPLDFC